MKVLLIDVNCKNSSTGRIVYDLYSHLNANGDIASVCYGRGEIIAEKNIFKFGLDWETNLHVFLTRITGFTGCFSCFSTRRLIQYIEEFQPDVVHIHELHAYFVNIVPLLNYLADHDIKVIHTLHCEFSYTGKCGHAMDCVQWKTACKQCPQIHKYPKSCFFDHTKHMFQQKEKAFARIKNLIITTPSQWLFERARQSFFSNRPIYTVHNGIDTTVFYPRETDSIRAELGIDSEKKVVLALAPHLMNAEKGGAYVLQLAEMLAGDAWFILVGMDGETLRKENNVILMGPTFDKDRLAQLYSVADLFVICSKRENYPTTCIEAQACGTPICGFDTGGTRETCITGTDDYFVPYGDLEALKIIILNAPIKPNPVSMWLTENAPDILSNVFMAERYREIYKNG